MKDVLQISGAVCRDPCASICSDIAKTKRIRIHEINGGKERIDAVWQASAVQKEKERSPPPLGKRILCRNNR